MAEMGAARALDADESVDGVITNCVLNLVRPEDKKQLCTEIFRVLKRGGRAVISDIVSDEDVPLAMQQDVELWSGCISGAFREDLFLDAFENAGFYGIEVLERQQEPWRTVEGIEFRSMTVAAYKGKQGECWEHKQAVIYKGPFRQVVDDDGHVLRRGMRAAVCEKTFQIYSKAPYRDSFALVPPLVPVAKEEAKPFPCTDRKSTRLNSSHQIISYAVFCLKKKKKQTLRKVVREAKGFISGVVDDAPVRESPRFAMRRAVASRSLDPVNARRQ